MKITEVETIPVHVPLKPDVTMKTAHGRHVVSPYVLVRVHTDEGITGIGEGTLSPSWIGETRPGGLAVIRDLFAPELVGQDPRNINALMRRLNRVLVGNPFAKAAIDMALWDLKGKYFQQPIHRLLGGKQHDRILAYASILFGENGAATEEIAVRWREAGYQAVKFGWEPMGQDENLDLELVRGARRGMGDDGTVLVDAGCVWDCRTALQRACAFADSQIGWLEEPLSPDDVDGYAWLRDRSPVPIAAGEEECGRQAMRPLIDRHALDVYQVDLSRNGFTEAHYIKQRVEEIGARLCNHCYTSPITVAASLHWLSTCRDAFLFEDCVEDSPLRHQLTHEKIQAEDGWMTVPDGPGLGVTLDEDFVEKYRIAESGRDIEFGDNHHAPAS